jgi:hypothetical protein
MARISSYNIDNALNPEDKWIGTDGAQGSENGKTKNFTVQGLTGYIADYIAQEGVAGPQGPQGIQGIPGNDGLDGVDGIDGTNGLDGYSAYDIWINNGNTGTEEDFLTSLNASISLTTNNTSGVSTYDPVTGVLNIPNYTSTGGGEITLTTIGSSGAATIVDGVLNIPEYAVGAAGIPWLESNGTDLTIWCNGKGNITTNTSYGDGSLKSNTTGQQNVSVGYNSLSLNTTGGGNVSVGALVLYYNTEGFGNTAIGNSSSILNTTGYQNSSLGAGSLASNTTGFNNTAVGNQAGNFISTGYGNVMLGYRAGFNYAGGTTNSICIGPNSGPSVANTVENGKLYIANASGTPLIGGDFVSKVVTIDGLLVASRFKVSSLNTAPTTSSSTGVTGEIRYDSDFIYVCVATNTWKRSALLSW